MVCDTGAWSSQAPTCKTKEYLGSLLDENGTLPSFDRSVLEHVLQNLSDLLATFCAKRLHCTVRTT